MHWNVENNVWNVDYPQVRHSHADRQTHTHIHRERGGGGGDTQAPGGMLAGHHLFLFLCVGDPVSCVAVCAQWYPFEGVYGYGNGGVADRTLGTDAAFRFTIEF